MTTINLITYRYIFPVSTCIAWSTERFLHRIVDLVILDLFFIDQERTICPFINILQHYPSGIHFLISFATSKLKIFWNSRLPHHDCFLITTSPNFPLKNRGIHSPEMISYHIIYWHVKLFTWMAIMLTRNYDTRTLYCLIHCIRYKITKTPSDDSQSTGK